MGGGNGGGPAFGRGRVRHGAEKVYPQAEGSFSHSAGDLYRGGPVPEKVLQRLLLQDPLRDVEDVARRAPAPARRQPEESVALRDRGLQPSRPDVQIPERRKARRA